MKALKKIAAIATLVSGVTTSVQAFAHEAPLIKCKSTAEDSSIKVRVGFKHDRLFAKIKDGRHSIAKGPVDLEVLRDGEGYSEQTRLHFRSEATVAKGGFSIRIITDKPEAQDLEGIGHVTFRQGTRFRNAKIICSPFFDDE